MIMNDFLKKILERSQNEYMKLKKNRNYHAIEKIRELKYI